MAIGLSHGGTTIYSSPSRSNEILVATTQGVVIIDRDASDHSWHVVHRALTDRHISAIVMEPESRLIFAGAFHGSLHVSDDGGLSWDLLGDGMPWVVALDLVLHDGSRTLFVGTHGRSVVDGERRRAKRA